jgi:hypothetical protein
LGTKYLFSPVAFFKQNNQSINPQMVTNYEHHLLENARLPLSTAAYPAIPSFLEAALGFGNSPRVTAIDLDKSKYKS